MNDSKETAIQEVLDEAGLMDEFEGDNELLAELMDSFFEDCPRLLTELREALAGGDAAALGSVAHTIKGGSGNFFAKAAFETALSLEQMGKVGDLSGADVACNQLERQLNQLQQTLQRLVKV